MTLKTPVEHRWSLWPLVLAVLLALAAGRAAAHGSEDHGDKPSAPVRAASLDASAATRLADGSLFVPKSMQRQLGIRTEVAGVGTLAASVELNGKVIADPGAGGRVQATQSGRIEPGAKGFPTLGQKVVKGQVLAYLRPAANSIERGNQEAQFAELVAQLAIAERKLARYEQLEGAIPAREIEAARFEAEALRRRHAAIGASFSAPDPLIAPVSGVIAATSVVAGQVVEARDVLFEVVDPARLAVEALAYDPALADNIAGASALIPGGELALRFVGGGRQLREQALPLLFRVESRQAPVAVGQPIKVIVRTRGTIQGVALPAGAVMRNAQGESVVWVHDGAEHFSPRRVRMQALDGGRVAVTAGLAGGERVVIWGNALLAQVK